MDKKYFDSTHRFGRIGALIGIVFMLGIPAVISQVYGVWPESVGSVFMTGSALLAVFIPSNISEVLSFSPVLGSASYIAFLTGNVTNLKLPCAMNAMTQADVSQEMSLPALPLQLPPLLQPLSSSWGLSCWSPCSRC